MDPPAPCALEQDERPWRTLKWGLWLGGGPNLCLAFLEEGSGLL